MTNAPSSEDRQWALWANLGGVLALAGIPYANLIGAIAAYVKSSGGTMPFAHEHARRALNFQITYSIVVSLLLVGLIAFWVPFMLTLASLPPHENGAAPPWLFRDVARFFGIVMLLVLLQLANVVCSVFGVVAATNGHYFRYWAIPFLRS